MSDSGKTLGDCRHGRHPEMCYECERAEAERLRQKLATARAEVFREAAEMAVSESEQAAAGWGCRAHASPGIAAALSSFAVELEELAREVDAAALEQRAGEGG